MRHIAATALTLAALAATLPSAAQTARLGSLPPSAQVVTNTSALQLTQAMLDALASTNAAITAALASNNAAITAALLARTNGWAQYDTLITQTNATVRLYQSENDMRWAWLTPTNIAVTTLTPIPGATNTNITWSPDTTSVNVPGAELASMHDAVAAYAATGDKHIEIAVMVSRSAGPWTGSTISYNTPCTNAFLLSPMVESTWSANGGSMYAGFPTSSNIWRTTNGGASWQAVGAFQAFTTPMGMPETQYPCHIYSESGADVIAVPATMTPGPFQDFFYYFSSPIYATNKLARSSDGGDTWTQFDPDYLYRNTAAGAGEHDFTMYANMFARFHRTPNGDLVNLCTWVHQSKRPSVWGAYEEDVIYSTNVIRRLVGTNWTDYAVMPTNIISISAAGNRYFGMPFTGVYTDDLSDEAVPLISENLTEWLPSGLPQCSVKYPYRFYHINNLFIAHSATNLYISRDALSWSPADMPFQPWAGRMAANAYAVYAANEYSGSGPTIVRTGVPKITIGTTSETLLVPLWGDWQSDVSAAAASALATLVTTGPLATTQHVAEAVGPLATTQHVAEAVGPLATTQHVAEAVAPLATTQQVAAAVAAIPAAGAFWPPNATASSWFTFTTNANEITITDYNVAGGTDVVIPDYINGLPVTAIGVEAFGMSGIVSLIAPQTVTSIGDIAFADCGTLVSVSFPQATAIGGGTFGNCYALASVSLPEAQTVGESAFVDCGSLASVSLPQVQTVGDRAFYSCDSLTSVYFDNDAPTIGAGIFAGIPPNQVTNYVTNPQATGWGSTLAGMPVVRLPLYADAIYQAGELVATTGHVAQAIAAIPDSIVRGVSVSSTNILVSSTNSVYYVALDNAANIGFDFSALSLGGTKRADITAVIDCLNTQALYSAINTNLVAMDCPWEPTVTGRYELAVSSDGVRTKVVQNSPSMCFFAPALINVDGGNTSYGALNTTLMPSGTLSREITIANENNPRELAFLRLAMLVNWPEVDGHLSFVCGSGIIAAFAEWSPVTNSVYAYPSGVHSYRPAYIPMRPAEAVSGFALPTRLLRVIKDVDDSRGTSITSATIRRMNALERAAYNAGAYPAAFRLDY